MNNHHTSSATVLIIRLNPDATTAIWRLAAPGDEAQSGEWHPDAGDPTLSLLAQRYPAWVLVPASDCAFHRVTLPAGVRRNAQQALAFLLEEQLEQRSRRAILPCSTGIKAIVPWRWSGGRRCAPGRPGANNSDSTCWH